MSRGLRRSSRYSLHRSTTSFGEVSSAPSPLYTVLIAHCFPTLRHWMVVQNLFETVQKSFAIASPNSAHPWVFASATAVAAYCLALVPVCCFWSPTGQKGLIGLLHQPDTIPYPRYLQAGAGFAATTGTGHLAATAPVSHLDNGGTEHGPFGLNVTASPGTRMKLSRRWVLKLLLMGDSARRSQQTLTIQYASPTTQLQS